MKKTVYISILLLSVAFFVSYVYAGGGYVGHGISRSGPSSYHGGEGGGGKYSGYAYPSVGYIGYGGKSSGFSTSSTGSKHYGGKAQQTTKGEKGSSGDVRTIEYGQGTPNEVCQKFLEELSAQRQEFSAKREAYFEKRQDPEANPEDIQRQSKEIRELFRAVEGRNINNCRWAY